MIYAANFFLVTHVHCLSVRRRKARQRQQRLMAEFASKQKEFMEKVLVDEEGVYTEQH